MAVLVPAPGPARRPNHALVDGLLHRIFELGLYFIDVLAASLSGFAGGGLPFECLQAVALGVQQPEAVRCISTPAVPTTAVVVVARLPSSLATVLALAVAFAVASHRRPPATCVPEDFERRSRNAVGHWTCLADTQGTDGHGGEVTTRRPERCRRPDPKTNCSCACRIPTLDDHHIHC